MNTTTLTIDLEFANKYGLKEAVFLAYLRRCDVDHSPPIIRSYTSCVKMFGLFYRQTMKHARDHMIEEGFVRYEERIFLGRRTVQICYLTDKAFKEYRFGE